MEGRRTKGIEKYNGQCEIGKKKYGQSRIEQNRMEKKNGQCRIEQNRMEKKNGQCRVE